ncbi:molybdopterin cofactor-binding domain-containing protein [Aquincola sp. MAHUQ-54]|uniref:Molybdopterin cofactor-binding domain-containing protein n=1 Tax=Aquincola agrisoli TaxID=3119538 RepID=A0AAW9Q4Q0_9BURK
MTRARQNQHLDRAGYHAAPGVLLVTREPPPPAPPSPGQPAAVPANPAEGVEILIAVWDDGSVTALHGHVDLGTGLRTSLAQLAAEELDVALDRVTMVMGSTGSAPNQGATIASASIQVHGAPLRQAAAQARAWLVQQAAEAAALPADRVRVNDGTVRFEGAAGDTASPARTTYGALLQGRHVELLLAPGSVPLKPAGEHRIVGQPVARVDIPAKVSGELTFVHDMRLPGMLHGRVVRPPYAGIDAGDFVGRTLEGVDEASIAHLPGIVGVVTQGDFVGIVAEREDQAEEAMRTLQVRWKPWPGLAGLDDVENAVRNNPATRRLLLERGDVEAGIAGAAQPMPRTYLWPYQLHASIGPSCALADWRDGAITVWAGTQNPHVLRADIAKLMGLPDTAVDLVRMEAAGCYGRNGADDVAADAALLSRAVGRPVRVQLTREQEHAWEPKGTAQFMQVDGGLNADGSPAAYDFQTSYPSNGAPTLALLLTRTIEPTATAYEMGDRTAVPPYDYANLRVAANDMAPILRASWLRGVSALPNSFAHESYVDELATAAGVDPVAYRLRYLKDERAAELVRATADKAGWLPHAAPQGQAPVGDVLKGQGFAYARYVHSKFPGFGAAWAAWVADVEVNRVTGEVHVSRVVVGHDAGMMVNPAGVQHQVHGNVLQTTSRALKEQLRTEPAGPNLGAVATREWGSYPILSFREVPVVEVMLMPRPGEAPLGAGESASVPGTAAIANAIFDATGVRFRNPPFTPEVVRAALGQRPLPSSSPHPDPLPQGKGAVQPRRRKGLWATAGALLAGIVGLGGAALGWRPVIAPITPGSGHVYTAETIERGRLVAAAGDCIVCHTAPGGMANAGGRAMATPFGTVYTTNLTPDADTGIGRWSFTAFQRAMREGLSRDGRHLYPAFPYTAFTRMTDDDLTALYAYLMAQPAVRSEVPATALSFPFGVRPLMALWNALYLQPGPQPTDPARSAAWNRGAYLVEGAGHCGACHTPRNAFGAERGGPAYLSGAVVDGWEAPSLTAQGRRPRPWTEDDFYSYLRRGFSPNHGVASGPMAPVVHELQALPDDDVRAMATYLASFNAPALASPSTTTATAALLPGASQRLFEGACGACHHDTPVPGQFGLDLPLALNTNVHSDRPDNLLRTILDGLQHPPTRDVGFMPAFRDALDDRQVAEIAAYMRARYAPGRPAWRNLEAEAARLRTLPAH